MVTTTFVDSSGLLAILDRADQQHLRARATWARLVEAGGVLMTTNYVLVESFSLLQARLGLDAAGALETEIVPRLDVVWVEPGLHRAGIATVLAAQRRQLSLVDCVSFEAMRRAGACHVFAFDRHFREQGFTLVA